MLNDSRTSGSRPGGVLIPMPRAGLPAALESRLCAIAPISEAASAAHAIPPAKRGSPVPAAHAAHGCVAVVLCSVLVAACGKTDPALDNDAYVWQRRWTPAVTAAMTDSADLVRAWRVLAADVAPDGKWSDATPALPALAAAGRPAIMVLRFDGRVDGLRDAEIHARIAALRDSWQRAGIALAGVEIDYDCATSKLPAYTRFLAACGRAWIRPSPVHHRPTDLAGQSRARRPARHPRRKRAAGPCRAQSDARTVRCRARRPGWTPTRRRPASPGAWLPAYGSRVAWDDEGRIAAVESEQPALMPGGRSAELLVTPADMAAFVSRIEDRRPPGLAGIVWFRLPTRVDARAWSLPTWRAAGAARPALSVARAGGARARERRRCRRAPLRRAAGRRLRRRRRHQRLHAGTRRTRHLPASRAGRPAARRRPTQHRLDTL